MSIPESRAAEALQLPPRGLPRPVTLLFGLPLTLEDFIDRLDSDLQRGSDFLAKYDDASLPTVERNAARLQWWKSRYEPNVARPLRDLAGAASSFGCDLRERATLADLSAAARNDHVVVVISHWKGPDFSNDDFLPGFEEALEGRLAAANHPLAIAILNSMRPQPSWLPFARPKPLSARAAVRNALNAVIADQQGVGDRHCELDATRRARRRGSLDMWLEGLIRPGNRIELFDRMHAAADLSNAISHQFTGVLDLTICTSTWLGDHLGRAAAQRFRTVQFIEPQDFLDAALRVRVTLSVYHEGDLLYLDARQAANEAYVRAVNELASQGMGIQP